MVGRGFVRSVGKAALAVLALAGLVAPFFLAVPSAGAVGTDGRQVLCDRADFGCLEGTGYHGQSVWGANYGRTGHNCTSYVSWVLAQRGASEPWHTMGNAGVWDDRGRGRVAVDGVPAVGAVAEWDGGTRYSRGSAGHVALVDAVLPDGIQISEDNSGGGTRRVFVAKGSPYWPSSFVHIHDLEPATITDWLWSRSNGMFLAQVLQLRFALGLPISD